MTPSRPWLAAAAMIGLLIVIEVCMGRSPLGPDHHFGLAEFNIWSSECSQRVIDPYSLSHLVHGFLFYAFLWLVARRLPVGWRFVLALAIECNWELLENSNWMIHRYRQTTIALGYDGDSILNSTGDLLMMAAGFWLAWRLPRWAGIGAVITLELISLAWIHDNLTLNVLMLIHPVEAIKAWQMTFAP